MSFDNAPVNNTINAHGEGMVTAHLNRLFNLSQPGQYSVQVKMNERTKDNLGDTNIVSGTARFQIVERLSYENGNSTNETLFFSPSSGSRGIDWVKDWLENHRPGTN